MNNTPKKGQIWHIEQGKTQTTGCEMWSNRFAVIVSNDVLNEHGGFVNVVYLTSKQKCSAPTHVKIKANGRRAFALCEQVFSVDKSRLGFQIDTLQKEDIKRIDQAILFTFGITNTLKPSTIYTKWANAIEKYGIDMSIDQNINTDINPENNTDTNFYKDLYEYEKQARIKAESLLQRYITLTDQPNKEVDNHETRTC